MMDKHPDCAAECRYAEAVGAAGAKCNPTCLERGGERCANLARACFSDQSIAPRGLKAERVLTALANAKDAKYFHDDGFPRRELASDAAATLAVLREMSASLKRYAATDRDELLRTQCDCVTKIAADGVPMTFCGSAQMAAARAADLARMQPLAEADGLDADRFRWLTEDHADPETRTKCRELLGRLGVMGRGAARADIDSAMADDIKRGMLRTVDAHVAARKEA